MRWTVLSSDILIFFPAVLYFVFVYHGGHSSMRTKSELAWHMAIILLSPCLILIDHGHFQVLLLLPLYFQNSCGIKVLHYLISVWFYFSTIASAWALP